MIALKRPVRRAFLLPGSPPFPPAVPPSHPSPFARAGCSTAARAELVLRVSKPRRIIGVAVPSGGDMRKQFVVPVLRAEDTLAQMTLGGEPISGRCPSGNCP